jgi:endonuclease/exonuclease/phosphatase family metal-dependent hydrolase
MRLDRIYVRGFSVQQAEIFSGAPWSRISDHAAVSADLLFDNPGVVHGVPVH